MFLAVASLANIRAAAVETTYHIRRTKATNVILLNIPSFTDTFIFTQAKMSLLITTLANIDATAGQTARHI